MKKGIVMEIDDVYLTLLTPDGQFLKARKSNDHCVIGEEIFFTPIDRSSRILPFNRFIAIKPLSIAAVILLLFLGTFVPMYQSNKAYAYMSIDVNPSIELGINKNMQVIELTAFNKDGKRIISNINNWKKQQIVDIAQSILEEMKKQGDLKQYKKVIISTVRTEKLEEKIEKRLTENMEEIQETVKENKLQLTVLTGTEKELEKAHQLGITTGKYQEAKKHFISKKAIKQSEVNQEEDLYNKKRNPAVPSSQDETLMNQNGNKGATSTSSVKEKESMSVPANNAPSGPLKKTEGSIEHHENEKKSDLDNSGKIEVEKKSPQNKGQEKKLSNSQETNQDHGNQNGKK